MTSASAMPTRRDEDFRYADLAALAPLWPVAAERIVLGPGEQRAMAIIHAEGDAWARDLVVDVAEGGRFALHLISSGQGLGRFTLRVNLAARAELVFGAAQLAGAGQTLEIVTQVVHSAPDAISRQVVRSVAARRSTVNYLGKVLVQKGADGTDGAQSVRAMLLDRSASANAKPELEIHADDVKCAHGCAVGELDAAALFYMAQRGLPSEAAKRLMLQAFVAEAFVGAEDGAALGEAAIAALEALV